MKKLLSILSAAMLLCSVGFTSCDDWDVPNTDGAYGNIAIPEGSTITIKALKEKYADVINNDGNQEITEETRIEGVIIGDDESGNIYKQLVVSDETGAIVVGINTTGLYAYTPEGQKVVIDCKGLYIGGRGNAAQLGAPYNGGMGRMSREMWEQHVRLLGAPLKDYSQMVPAVKVISSKAELDAIDMSETPMLVTFADVTFKDADGKEVYAPESDENRNVKRYFTFSNGDDSYSSRTFLYNSPYASFAKDVMPQGKVDVTGILIRYRRDKELILRSANDVVEKNNK